MEALGSLQHPLSALEPCTADKLLPGHQLFSPPPPLGVLLQGTHTKKLTSASDMSALLDSGLQQQQQQQQRVQAANSRARPHSRL
jgi:hypothetical protein